MPGPTADAAAARPVAAPLRHRPRPGQEGRLNPRAASADGDDRLALTHAAWRIHAAPKDRLGRRRRAATQGCRP